MKAALILLMMTAGGQPLQNFNDDVESVIYILKEKVNRIRSGLDEFARSQQENAEDILVLSNSNAPAETDDTKAIDDSNAPVETDDTKATDEKLEPAELATPPHEPDHPSDDDEDWEDWEEE